LAASSEPVAFDVTVDPPEVAFIQAPVRVVRQTTDSDTPLADIPPTFIDLPLLVTFPDGHPRRLAGLQLFVNGELQETVDEPPFDRVRWDLSSIVESRAFLLRATVSDSQGLTASSEIAPISVEVIPGPRGLDALRPALAPLFAGLAIIAAAAALVAAWVRLGEAATQPEWESPSAEDGHLSPRQPGPTGATSSAEASCCRCTPTDHRGRRFR
jgi:hypothetical protein